MMSDGVLSTIGALNMEQDEGLKKMSKEAIEKLLKRMASDNWLDIVSDQWTGHETWQSFCAMF